VIKSGQVNFTADSLIRNANYLPDPILNIDRTETTLFKEIHIKASTLNPLITTTLLPIVITICNSNMTLVAETVPPSLTQKHAVP